jgi:hypothetical protein
VDGTVPRANDGGFDCVSPSSLPLKAQEALAATEADDAGMAADAGTALHAERARALAPTAQILLGSPPDSGLLLSVNGGFHVQGFPVIGRVTTASVEGVDSSSALSVLSIPLPRPDAGTYRYRASAVVTSDKNFPDFAVCQVDARVDSAAAKDSYKVTAGFDQQANLVFEGVVPPGATLLSFFLSTVGQADGGVGALCTLKSLNVVVEVFR